LKNTVINSHKINKLVTANP